jgi:hypothetical protein
LDVAVPLAKASQWRPWSPVWAGWIVVATLVLAGVVASIAARKRD